MFGRGWRERFRVQVYWIWGLLNPRRAGLIRINLLPHRDLYFSKEEGSDVALRLLLEQIVFEEQSHVEDLRKYLRKKQRLPLPMRRSLHLRGPN